VPALAGSPRTGLWVLIIPPTPNLHGELVSSFPGIVAGDEHQQLIERAGCPLNLIDGRPLLGDKARKPAPL
jgi:hypothetical protein